MITLKQWMELVNYKITEACDYYPDVGRDFAAQSFDYWDGDHDGVSTSIVFSREDHNVIHVSVCDYKNKRAYRLINKEYCDSQDIEHDPEAWDEADYVDLDDDEDMLSKLSAILSYQPYDTRVTVNVDMTEDDWFTLMKRAHREDITLNKLVEKLLNEYVAANTRGLND